jgi:hypothetical protein
MTSKWSPVILIILLSVALHRCETWSVTLKAKYGWDVFENREYFNLR